MFVAVVAVAVEDRREAFEWEKREEVHVDRDLQTCAIPSIRLSHLRRSPPALLHPPLSSPACGWSLRRACSPPSQYPRENMVLQEGPIDGSLLTFQQSHRSHSIWANNGEPPVDSNTVKVRRTEARLKKLPPPPAPPVLQLIRQAGFGGVVDLPFISLDLGLMAALLERWRPETHSFHLRAGECTVTL
ncbi:hypothetical protein RHMOL_Rhmol10G0164900 [Rhododendron molle]|uniref:Uncharacterized protein n=1 Tax=Rhododendron molle TaxID=49168 RepID=A0ACC0M3H8_RHOML|nr:hypothetical protein RHMOL_Rhmol10G0164900 [Rhododendron molle]